MKCTFALLISGILLLSLPASGQLMKIKTIAGNGIEGYSGDGMAATGANLHGPVSVALDPAGNVYFVDYFNLRVRKIAKSTGVITTVAGTGVGGYTGDSSLATSAEVDPQGVAFDKHGNMYIADGVYSVIRKVNTLGIITTIAGNGTHGYTGDNGPARSASFSAPRGLTVDSFGNIFVADAPNNVIRKISASGTITTVAGSGTAGYGGDGGPATAALLDSPYAVAVDHYGNLYISDYKNNVVRVVDSNGDINAFAGTAGAFGYAGDNSAAITATLNFPAGLAVDTFGNVIIADAHNNVIRSVNKFGVIRTVVGNGAAGFGGDLGNALGAQLLTPFSVATDISGNIYIADANNQRIREAYYDALSVSSEFTRNNLEMHPNPSSSQISLSGLTKTDKVCVYDLAGSQIGTAWDVTTDGSQTFDIQSLASGVYVLQVFSADGNRKAVGQLVKE